MYVKECQGRSFDGLKAASGFLCVSQMQQKEVTAAKADYPIFLIILDRSKP